MKRRELIKGLIAAGIFTVTGFGWKSASAEPCRHTSWDCPGSDPLADIQHYARMLREDCGGSGEYWAFDRHTLQRIAEANDMTIDQLLHPHRE